MTKEELEDINCAVPLINTFITESYTKLLNEINTLQYERDEYKRKYENECELRRLANEYKTNE